MSTRTIPRDDVFASVVPDDAPEIVTVPEAAAFFGVHQGTVFYSLRTGKLRTYPLVRNGVSVKGVALREAALIWGLRRLAATTTT
ncbi:hypothetical protein [Mycobacteroides abscessus]|uniref:hypothetical protein n=1 Tax=Mycobacteroides abscessus TaxID=36809 RepID=UPI00103F5F8D|nr:hypothetical protein [Mycobacteroides abscessus]